MHSCCSIVAVLAPGYSAAVLAGSWLLDFAVRARLLVGCGAHCAAALFYGPMALIV